MIYPPIYETLQANAVVQSMLGDSAGELRAYPHGDAKQKTERPYVTWQEAYGSPYNYVNQSPDGDTFGIQFDVYCQDAEILETIVEAIRDAIQDTAYITSWNGNFPRDTVTRNYRSSFTVDWIVQR